jgi:hypothetical protein
MSFVNHKGELVDMQALIQAGIRQRHLERLAGVVARKPTAKNGYAAPPGTGPAGETCKGCAHKRSMGNYGSKHFIKCELRRSTWTHGEGTDILASAAACSQFERAPKTQPGSNSIEPNDKKELT